MQQQNKPIFTNHQLITLLWPLIIEQALEVLVGMADTMMVSSAGEAAISGVSLVDMINQLIITIFGALATGGAVVTSQYLGARKNDAAARSAGQLVTLSAILGCGAGHWQSAAARKIGSGCIFITRNGKPKDRSNLWSEMKALKKRAGVSGEKIFPHNLRHLFARVYYQTTKDLTGLADVLGHSSLNVTRIYTSNTGELYQRQLDRMTALRI